MDGNVINLNGHNNGHNLPSNARQESRSVDARSSVPRLVYTVKEAAFALHVSERTMWRMVYDRQVKATKIRGRVMIPVAVLQEYIERNLLREY